MLLQEGDTLCEALLIDFNKPIYETYLTEHHMILQELDLAIRSLKKWMRPKKQHVFIPVIGTTRVIPEPYGVCAVFAPANYPLQLALIPLIGAIAAGNSVVLKLSEYTPHTAKRLKQLLATVFPPHLVYTLLGDAHTAQRLLKQPLDYIFFTGSTGVGKKVMAQAAQTLTPLTLELGGKSPVIVDYSADIKLAAKRIAWGKFLNAGQTCVAPDYVLVHDAVADAFLEALMTETSRMFGTKASFPRMTHDAHYVRVLQCINEDKVYYGGHFDADTRYIEPTILYPASLTDTCMQEEIFGPILPVIPFSKLSTAIETVKRFPKPLACYVFTKDTARKNHLLKHLSFGGGAINDTILQLAGTHTPFGGIGYSGMGSYHGKYTFDTFTHYKTILSSSAFEVPLRYPPYNDKLQLLKRYMDYK